MVDDLDGFLPVGPGQLAALDGAVRDAREAERALREAAERSLELSADLSMDAVRGLRDRGASAAQIERYEAAHRDAARALRDRLRTLRDALEAVAAGADALRG